MLDAADEGGSSGIIRRAVLIRDVFPAAFRITEVAALPNNLCRGQFEALIAE
jgi:hypothetical protein